MNNQIKTILKLSENFVAIHDTNCIKNKIINNLNSIYNQINRYNNEYWNFYNLVFYICYTSVVCTILFQVLYGEMNLITRFIFGYSSMLGILITTFYMASASLVPHESRKTHQLLIHLLLYKKQISILNKIKVI